MSNFWQRAITGTLFVIVLVGAVLWNKYSFIGLLFVIAVLGIWEYATLFKGRKHKPNFLGTVVAGTGVALFWSLLCIGLDEGLFGSYLSGFCLGCLLFPALSEIVLNKKPSLTNVGLSYSGIIYINLGLFCFVMVQNTYARGCYSSSNTYNGILALGFLILLWSSDTFAYLTGRAFGKTPLSPKISPKKTWEGSIGGAICTMALSFLLYKYIGCLNLFQWIGLALIIVVFGTFGDLIESRLKRRLGIKDSGKILPGHGGILDRFDSLLFSTPFAAIFLVLTELNKYAQ
jgi:phosphatidate cytidylyltransferase